MGEPRVVGRAQRRADAQGKVLGQAMYVGDLQREHPAHGAVLRSPYHHARVLTINGERAKGIEGVLAVLTAAIIPGPNRFGVLIPDQPVLAEDVVRFQGEALALVVAENEALARQTLDLIEVSCEPLPTLFDPEVAMATDAPLLHPEGNLLDHRRIYAGDIEDGLARADIVVAETFETPFVDHAYLEPEAALSDWQEDGTLTVWASSQTPIGTGPR
jgi:CO/xanthine dehydrogenase Mo-binding subunit